MSSPESILVRPSPVSGDSRLLFIDNIRWVVIVQVICHHAAVTYGHIGGWYLYEGSEPGLPLKLFFAVLLSFDQAYFMGLLFFVSGYFVPRAFDSKGPALFLRDRAIRLGIPSLFFMLVIQPVVVYWLVRFADPNRPSLPAAYWPYLASGRVLGGTGPMWFAVALLLLAMRSCDCSRARGRTYRCQATAPY